MPKLRATSQLRHSGESRNPVPFNNRERKAKPKTSGVWSVRRLGDSDVAQLVMGQSPPSNTYNTGKIGLPFFQGKADFGYISPNPRVWCSEPTRTGQTDDILMSVRAPVGDVNLATEACALGRGVAAIRAAHSANFTFLFYALQFSKSQLVAASSGAIFESINKTALHDLEIPLPPKPEQEKIATVLWKLQRAIATQDRLIAATADLKAAAMQRLFTRGLRGEPLKDTEIGPMPESWPLIRLGDAYSTQLGKMLSQKARIGNSPKPYLRNKNVQWGRLDVSDLLVMDFNDRESAKFKLTPGDLLICEGGVIGRAAIWHGELDECYFQKAIHRVRPKDESSTNEFLCYWLSFSFEHQNLYNIGGASSTIAHLPQILLEGLKIPLPAIDEQRDIAATLATIDRKLAHHRAKRAALNDLFETLLYKLMTAEIRVADLDIDVSEVANSLAEANKIIGHKKHDKTWGRV